MLTKSTLSVMVSPGSPGRPAVPGSDFQLFAPPPAAGYHYNAPLPTSMAAFSQWKQLIDARNVSQYGYGQFLTAREFFNSFPGLVFDSRGALISGSIAYPDPTEWEPVHEYVNNTASPPIPPKVQGALLGFRYIGQPVEAWFNAPAGMTYMQARGAAGLAPNGYPLNAPEADFYFAIEGVEYGARYARAGGGFGGNFYFRKWITPAPPAGDYEMRGWTGILAVPAMAGAPAVPGVPPTYAVDYLDGWNAGANSVLRLDGNVRTTFRVNTKVAVVVGFAPDGAVVDGDYTKIHHGLLVDATSGELFARSVEHGRLVGEARWLVAGPDGVTTPDLRIERVGGVVGYYVQDGAERYTIHNSDVLSTGALQVSAAIYHGGDRVI